MINHAKKINIGNPLVKSITKPRNMEICIHVLTNQATKEFYRVKLETFPPNNDKIESRKEKTLLPQESDLHCIQIKIG